MHRDETDVLRNRYPIQTSALDLRLKWEGGLRLVSPGSHPEWSSGHFLMQAWEPHLVQRAVGMRDPCPSGPGEETSTLLDLGTAAN